MDEQTKRRNDELAYQRYLKIRSDRRWENVSYAVAFIAFLAGAVQLIGLIYRIWG